MSKLTFEMPGRDVNVKAVFAYADKRIVFHLTDRKYQDALNSMLESWFQCNGVGKYFDGSEVDFNQNDQPLWGDVFYVTVYNKGEQIYYKEMTIEV